MITPDSHEPTRPPESPEPVLIGDVLRQLVVKGDNFPPPKSEEADRDVLKEYGESQHYWLVVDGERRRLKDLIQAGTASPTERAQLQDIEALLHANVPEHIEARARFSDAQDAKKTLNDKQSTPDES